VRAPHARMQVPAEREVDTAVPDAPPRAPANMEQLNSVVFRRAEFWQNETATLLEVVNVLGRFDNALQFAKRTEFTEIDDQRAEDERQSGTLKRYEMAQRMKCAERVALQQNAPTLPFTDAALAASVGLAVEDFEDMPVTKAATNIVYDALAESRSSLIPYDVITARRGGLVTSEGEFNELAFRSGLYKSRALIIFAWFLFGKGNFVWVLVGAKFLHDARPDIFPTPAELGLFKIGAFI